MCVRTHVRVLAHIYTHTEFSFHIWICRGVRGKGEERLKKKKTSSKFDLNKMVIQMGPLLISQRCVIISNIWL